MIPIVTDREQGIRSAIKKSLPSNPILLCWNHLIGDFKTWLRKIKSKSIVIESNCECGQADTVENMVGCEWSRGVKKCNVWKHMSCAGLNGLKDDELLNWYCQKHHCE